MNTRQPSGASSGGAAQPPVASPVDWIEEGKKHFLATKLHPERPCANYPTQDIHPPKAEADFILGFNAAKAAWERGEGLNGLSAYALEMDERGQLKLVPQEQAIIPEHGTSL